MTGPEENTDNIEQNLLTRIRDAYTVGDTGEPESEEMDELIVKNFIDILAEVSLSIASRRVKETEQ